MCLKGDEESYHLAISDAREVFLVKVVGAAARGWVRRQPAGRSACCGWHGRAGVAPAKMPLAGACVGMGTQKRTWNLCREND